MQMRGTYTHLDLPALHTCMTHSYTRHTYTRPRIPKQAEGVTVTEVFVDTVGDPDWYQRKLQGLFSHVTPSIQV